MSSIGPPTFFVPISRADYFGTIVDFALAKRSAPNSKRCEKLFLAFIVVNGLNCPVIMIIFAGLIAQPAVGGIFAG